MRVGFLDHAFSYRGTSRAILAYAEGLARYHDIYPSIYFLKDDSRNAWDLVKEIAKSGLVDIVPVQSLKDIPKDLDWLYYVTADSPSRITSLRRQWLSDRTHLFLHQVGFQEPTSLQDGDVHAYTSQWQSYYFTAGTELVLPYIIPSQYFEPSSEDSHLFLRQKLKIPNNVLVLGRHGGPDTWNLPFANTAVSEALNQREDLYFIFLGTPPFCSHERAIFLPPAVASDDIISFIDACDAMIHCRWEGETFGLACAEFLARSKPIITWSNSRERHHIYMADRSCIFYEDLDDLLRLLSQKIDRDFIHSKARQIPQGLISKFSEEVIIPRFRDMLIREADQRAK